MEGNRSAGRILVAMSGGVDSSTAALLLKKEGYDIRGAILRMHDAGMSTENLVNGKLPLSIWYAREAARKMRIDFSIIDVRDDFDKRLEKYFISNFENGVPLDPDFYTQKHLQLAQMSEACEAMGCDMVATGHYVIIEYNDERGRYVLRRAKDREKDQTYKLYRLSQKDLSHIIAPLGSYEKEEIRRIAMEAGLKNAKAADDLCFIPDKDYWRFVGRRLQELAGADKPVEQIVGLAPGNFVDEQGNVIGRHRGFLYYTVGQRDGLEEAGMPENLYVCRKRADTNEIILTDEDGLYTYTVRACKVNFVSVPELPGGSMRVNTVLHYGGKEQPGTAAMLDDGTLEVRFDAPVRAPVPGLSMVLYDGDEVIAGGIIM
ncbi:MAG: hypothetical protein HUJ76_02385 [Parasporobacterium sp.]|nr:hypothetical protein [Parasporobacterium sp.]